MKKLKIIISLNKCNRNQKGGCLFLIRMLMFLFKKNMKNLILIENNHIKIIENSTSKSQEKYKHHKEKQEELIWIWI